MKLRKQAPLKLGLLAVISALLAGFFAVVRSETNVIAQTAPPTSTPVNYGGFFAPNIPTPAANAVATPLPQPRPHTRTRAS